MSSISRVGTHSHDRQKNKRKSLGASLSNQKIGANQNNTNQEAIYSRNNASSNLLRTDNTHPSGLTGSQSAKNIVLQAS